MGRLRKGDVAPGIAARSERAKESIAARLKVLDELQRNRSKCDDGVLVFFETVDALAGWTDAGRRISPVSPKTMRKHIERMYEGGYVAFMAALEQVRSMNTPAGLHPSVEAEVRRRIQQEAAAVLEMTNRYLDLIKRMRGLADASPAAMTQLKHHLQVFGSEPPHLTRVK